MYIYIYIYIRFSYYIIPGTPLHRIRAKLLKFHWFLWYFRIFATPGPLAVPGRPRRYRQRLEIVSRVAPKIAQEGPEGFRVAPKTTQKGLQGQSGGFLKSPRTVLGRS